MKAVIEAGSRPKIPDDCPLPLKQLLEGCWKQEPSYRFGYAEVCEKLDLIKALAEPQAYPWGAAEPEGGWAAAATTGGGGGDAAPAEEAAAPAEEAAAPAEDAAAPEAPPAEEVSAAEPVAEE